MRLSALDIAGFKSFAKPSHLEFREGLTGIVGPNGSGKSNIADAIRWVLGEQSMKTLRGKKSEDVIFGGSGNRGRLGMAEVSLTLANENERGPVDVAEVVITRRLYRSGESVYLLNNRPVRLLDVADILAKAGFGQKTYTVIGQGMADEFVNASPTERRAMFEDATGVTSLLLKKDQAERKLEQTKEHLVRARDLLRELEPRLRSLKRQAARARSREQLEQELRAAESTWYAHLWLMYDGTLREARASLLTVDERIVALSKKLTALRPPSAAPEAAAQLPALRAEIEKLREEEQSVAVALAQRGIVVDDAVDRRGEERHAREKERQKLSGLILETSELLEKKEALLRTTRETLRKLQNDLLALQGGTLAGKRAAVARDTIEEIVTRQEALIEHLTAVETVEEIPPLQEEADHIKVLLQELLGQLDGAEEHATSPEVLRDQLEKESGTRDALEKEVADARVRLATLESQLHGVEARLADLARGGAAPETQTPEGKLAAQLEDIRQRRAALVADADDLEARLLRAHSSRQAADAEIESLRGELHAAEQEKHTIDINIAATQARKEDTERDIAATLGDGFLGELHAGHVEQPAPRTVDGLESTIHRLRDKVSHIGGIDAGVLQEEADVEQRVTSLRTQVHDLDTATAHLRGGIRELEGFIHRQFTDGMRKTDDAFNTYFRQIFGGGRAGLSIVKPRPVEHALPDVPAGGTDALPEAVEEAAEEEGAHVHELPAGVEIRANPPGKKLTSISQLSGGEKALTSIALLFAIISQRPSPFIVLDEVDAALDEANSRRFARMLQQLVGQSQFLVITHNRATMEAAGALYGVTMSDDGVSQLLSIRLAEVPETLSERGAP